MVLNLNDAHLMVYLFMQYLMVLKEAQSLKCQMQGWLQNNELEGMFNLMYDHGICYKGLRQNMKNLES
jgi:hypothetical protein